MRIVPILIGIATLWTVTACALLDPARSIAKTTYIGHTSDEIVSAVRAGRVKSVLVAVDHGTGKPVSLFVDLRNGDEWSLSSGDPVSATLTAIDGYNAAAPKSARVVVNQEVSYSAPTPISPGPSPTSHPRVP